MKMPDQEGTAGRAPWWRRAAKRYGLDAMSAMALGLFSTLVIGVIMEQLGRIPGLGMLQDFAKVAKSEPVVGAGIGVAIAWGLKVVPLAIFTSAVVGALGYGNGVGPLGAYIAAVIGAELGNRIAGKTRLDIVLVPSVTLLSGGVVALLLGPSILGAMRALQSLISTATTLQPVPMGILVAVVVGLALTGPISSAALCAVVFKFSGEPDPGLLLAAGAATVGCCAQMVGFAVASFPENGVSGLIAQGLGTSMVQIPNILRRPAILLPPTLAAAVLGPLATTVLVIHNAGVEAGMGTSGLVGLLGVWSHMSGTEPALGLLGKLALMCVALPAGLSLGFSIVLRRWGWIRPGDMTLPKL
ncbi:MAG: PTS sugar transporter subunit IIC [Clostridia bacterium]|nr:PTS sugar transporter subunit IIC [Clostridia bacterium]